MNLRKLVLQNKSQYLVFSYLFGIVTLCCLILCYIDVSPFQIFIGDINPLLLLFIAYILGFAAHLYLMNKTSFVIYKKQQWKTFFWITTIAIFFGLEVIAADIWLVDYSAEINILFPKSILFYPVIAFIIEVFFHLIPISIIVFILSLSKKISINDVVLVSIIIVALLEPLYQIWFIDQNSITAIIYTGIHVLLINLTQLLIFKRFGFISMYYFRIIFYIIWHILWGYTRLELLF